MTEEWIDTDEEPRYTAEEILRVADWLVRERRVDPRYAERLRQALESEG